MAGLRGLSIVLEPSMRVLKSIGEALNVSAETRFVQAGLVVLAENLDEDANEHVIRTDRRLTEAQRHALLGVYRGYVGDSGTEDLMQSPVGHQSLCSQADEGLRHHESSQ